MMLESAKSPIRAMGVLSLATLGIDATVSLIRGMTLCGATWYGAGICSTRLFRLLKRYTSNESRATRLLGKITIVLLLVLMVVVRQVSASTRPIISPIRIASR